ncbi:MAG: arginine repressor [Chloroflexi bacterium]|nr:arginine repressor [Chloroflexota bacterium]
MKSDAKQVRHRLIRQIVASGAMRTQEDLVDALARQDVHVTQATVSRDMVELGLIRAAVDGHAIYTLPESVSMADSTVARRRLRHLLGEVPIAFGDSAALLVVRTAPGMANVLAVTLDSCAFPEVVGTVAGDDTIFLALRYENERDKVRGYLTDIGVSS